MNTNRGLCRGGWVIAATGVGRTDSGSRSGTRMTAISAKRWTIIDMRTPSRTDKAPSTLGVSGRESSKSIYISDLVDYIIRADAQVLPCDEHVDDAEGQRDCTHSAKPCVTKLLGECLGGRKCLHRFRKVCIRARMFGDKAADERQHVSEVPEVKIAQRWRARKRKFQNHEGPARLQHSGNFAAGNDRLFDVANAEPDRGRVDGLISKRDAHCIAADKGDRRGWNPGAPDFGASDLQHRGREIDTDDALRMTVAGDRREREIGRAGAKIEHGFATTQL